MQKWREVQWLLCKILELLTHISKKAEKTAEAANIRQQGNNVDIGFNLFWYEPRLQACIRVNVQTRFVFFERLFAKRKRD